MEGFNRLQIKAKQIGLITTSDLAAEYVRVPPVFWCGNYLVDPEDKNNYNIKKDKDGNKVIADGSSCCFMHFRGLPKRWGVRHPLYSWQEKVLTDLKDENNRFFFILKPSKIGATELILAWAAHQALTNKKWEDGQVAVVSFTGQAEAQNMIHRLKNMILHTTSGKYKVKTGVSDTRNEITINKTRFSAYPAMHNHINAIRSQPNMRLIIYDEAAFPADVEQQKIRDAAEHYAGGSEAKIIVITTAGDTPSGFAYDIYNEEDSIYKKHILDYHAGMEIHKQSGTSLFNPNFISQAKKLTSFQKNYMHQWGFGSGDIFDSTTLSLISTMAYPLESDVTKFDNILLLDPAYGQVRTKTSSKFAMLGMIKRDGIVYTNSLTEMESPSDEEALAQVRRIIKHYGYTNLGVDAAWPGITNTFSGEIITCSYAFGDVGLDMTDNASFMTSNMDVRIHPSHEQLIQQLRAIVRNDRGMPDKKKVRFDAGDCFLMGCWYFKNGWRRIADIDQDEIYEKNAGFGNLD